MTATRLDGKEQDIRSFLRLEVPRRGGRQDYRRVKPNPGLSGPQKPADQSISVCHLVDPMCRYPRDARELCGFTRRQLRLDKFMFVWPRGHPYREPRLLPCILGVRTTLVARWEIKRLSN